MRETLRALRSVGVVVALLGTRRNGWAGRVGVLTGLGGGGKVLHKQPSWVGGCLESLLCAGVYQAGDHCTMLHWRRATVLHRL